MKLLLILFIGLNLMAVQTAPGGYQYSGNNDFRGYLAANAPQYLPYTGNDGIVNQTDYYSNRLGGGSIDGQSFNMAGLSGAGGNSIDTGAYNNTSQTVKSLYDQFQAAQGQPVTQNQSLQVDPNIASQKSLINSQLGQLDPQLQVGLDNIGNSYNLSANRLDEQNAAAKRNYETSGQQNTQNYLNTRNGIVQNTRNTNFSLQRLLGMNGAGNSSAAYEQAPYAAALQGSQNLTGAQQTFGNNTNALDTNWQDTQRSYKNSLDDLNTQKYQQENSLRSSIQQARANLLGRMGQVGGIDDILSQITQLGQQYASPVLRTSDVNFAAPQSAAYTLGRQQAPTAAGAQGDINPTFLGLLTGQRDQYGNLIQQ